MTEEIVNNEPEEVTPEVEVTVVTDPVEEEETPDVIVAEGDTTVIVEPPVEDGVSDEEPIDRWIDLERWKGQMEGTILAQEQTIARLEGELAARPPVEEEPAPPADAFTEAENTPDAEEHAEDEAPKSAGTHWLFESRNDRKTRKSNR